MSRPRTHIAQCNHGGHRPRLPDRRIERDVIRTTCRDCGGALMRTAATRRWIYSGLLF